MSSSNTFNVSPSNIQQILADYQSKGHRLITPMEDDYFSPLSLVFLLLFVSTCLWQSSQWEDCFVPLLVLFSVMKVASNGLEKSFGSNRFLPIGLFLCLTVTLTQFHFPIETVIWVWMGAYWVIERNQTFTIFSLMIVMSILSQSLLVWFFFLSGVALMRLYLRYFGWIRIPIVLDYDDERNNTNYTNTNTNNSTTTNRTPSSSYHLPFQPNESDIEQLIAMGFTRQVAIQALTQSRGQLEQAINILLEKYYNSSFLSRFLARH